VANFALVTGLIHFFVDYGPPCMMDGRRLRRQCFLPLGVLGHLVSGKPRRIHESHPARGALVLLRSWIRRWPPRWRDSVESGVMTNQVAPWKGRTTKAAKVGLGSRSVRRGSICPVLIISERSSVSGCLVRSNRCGFAQLITGHNLRRHGFESFSRLPRGEQPPLWNSDLLQHREENKRRRTAP
jgi:hypothetical protein